ncbi:MAG: response regulator transcription factor [Kiritimatiellae bacterium]|nr:response regulator transcription factor [Kiritimatiellia bacterium]MBQ8126738.1 response regulator transcription factor [Kiritimatiellia bacterium]
MEKIKVMIVDDHAILRMGLASLLNAKKDIEVVGEANSGAAALKKAPKLKPDVIVMDLMMPEMDGAETTRRLKALMPEARILILTTYGTSDGIAHALEAGARGAVLKNVEFTELANDIRRIAAGETVVSEEIQRILKAEPAIEPLSARQYEILEAIVNGLSNADISTRLGISLDMVKEHNQKLFEKLGAANRTEAVAITMRKYLLKF